MIPFLPSPAVPDLLFPAVVSPIAAQLFALMRQLETTQYLPAAELRARQFRQIDALVAHIGHAVPAQAARLRAAGLEPGVPITEEAWARLPILTRRMVQDAGESLKATTLPEHHGKVVRMGTSGSTGSPLTVWKTELEQIYWSAFTLRDLLWQQFPTDTRFGTIRNDWSRDMQSAAPPEKQMPNWGPPVSHVCATGPAFLLDVRTTVAEQFDWLERTNPALLLTFPSVLDALARHGLAHGRRPPGLRGLRTSGETLSMETRELCRQAFGLEIADMYSAVETGYLALQCGDGRYHLQSESALIELLHDDGTPCAAGEVGQVVVTPLHNFAMPLLRYHIGDYAEAGAPCPCGRTLPVVNRILGRARDMLRLPDGQRRFPEYGKQAFNEIPAILQHQAIQVAPDVIEFHLRVRRKLTEAEEARLLDNARRNLGSAFKLRLIYRDTDIPRGPTGKYQEFRCEVPDTR